ncbi:MAG: PAS domain S-box protein [Alphaproteobacteria bacterium]|nr:PAS domain S-box protein [Alphaproteobacteria bacterium]
MGKPENGSREAVLGRYSGLPTLGVALVGEAGDLLAINDRLRQMLDLRGPEETLPSYFDLTADADQPREAALFHTLKSKGDGSYAIAKKMRRSGGDLLDVECLVASYQDHDGIVFIILVQDTNESLALEAALELSKLSFDETSDGMLKIGPDGAILSVNKAACALLGYSSRELLKLCIFDIDLHLIGAKWPGLWRHMRESKLHSNFEALYRRKDGKTFAAEISAAYVSHGEHEFVFASFRDFSQRRKRELEEAAEGVTLKEIVEGMPIAVLVTRLSDGVIMHANPMMGRVIGMPPAKLLGRPVTDIYTDKAQRRELTNRLKRDGEVNGFDVSLVGDHGRAFWARASSRLVTFAKTEAVLSTLYDISTEREAREHLAQRTNDLKSSQERYALAMEASREGIYDLDLESGMLFVSPRIEAIFGIPSHGLRTAKDWLSRILPEDMPRYRQAATGHFKGHTPSMDAEYRISSMNGEIIWIRERSVCQRNKMGRAVRLVGSVGDVTELKRAQAALEAANATLEQRVAERTEELRQTTSALKAREDRLHGILYTVADGILTIDGDGLVESFNPAAERVFGYSAHEVLGQRAALLMPNLFMHCQAGCVKESECLEDLVEQETFEVEGRRKDASEVPLEASISELHLPGRKLYTVVLRDVSDRKAAEEALRHSERRYRSIFEQAAEGIFQSTPDGRYIEASPSLAKLYGYASVEELMSNVVDISCQIYLNSNDRDRYLSLMSEAGEVRGFEYQVLRRDGVALWVSENSRAVRDAAGKVLYYEGTVEDITERKLAEHEAVEKQSLLEATLDNITQAVAIFDFDLRLLDVNDLFGKMLNLPGRLTTSGTHVVTIMRFMSERGDAIGEDDPDWQVAQGGELALSKVERQLASGAVVQVSARRLGDGKVLLTYTDVTDLKRREAALKQSEERYALAAQGANDGLWDWDIKNNRVYYSQRWKNMLGCREDEIGGGVDDWFSRVHSDDIDELKAALDAHLVGATTHVEVEYRIRHNDGRYRWMLLRGSSVADPMSGRPARMAGSQTDITERKRTEQQLLHDAFHDGLTGLPNRALFMDRLGQALTRSKRDSNRLFAVMFLDLDHFKYVNDSLGHSAGDSLIVSIARRLDNSRRASDTVARLGGDEFALLIEDVASRDSALDIAERLRQSMSKPVSLLGQEIYPTASMGIALVHEGYERPEDMLIDADLAMYEAKSVGRDRIALFSPEMRVHSSKQLELGSDLRRAFERNELVMFYQPIVGMQEGRIAGFEALIRWRHPTRGIVPPGDFIPLAEETGLIVPIGWWVIEESARRMHAWNAERAQDKQMMMSINISARQFKEPGLIDRIADLIEENAFNPFHIKLEITESLLMDNPEVATEWLSNLKALGVSLSIDDFGTGYSSLSYLHRFPFDYLKVDRSFVATMFEKRENMEIVRAIIALGTNLGMQIIAEGVETVEQYEVLRELGCHYAQGYYFSRPIPEADAQSLMSRDPKW